VLSPTVGVSLLSLFDSLLWKRRAREDFVFYFKSPLIPLFLRGKIKGKKEQSPAGDIEPTAARAGY
jgi:hypothetical protein